MLQILKIFGFYTSLSLSSALSAQCVDTSALAVLQNEFRTKAWQFWPQSPCMQSGIRANLYQEEIRYLEHKLPLSNRPVKDEQHIRIWKWSEWHTGGYVYQLRYVEAEWKVISFVFNEYRTTIRSKKVLPKVPQDSLAARLERYNLMLVPNQPQHRCQPREVLYAYIIEVWKKGNYRFYYYEDPERYAAQGSWADAYLLNALIGLWE